MNQETLQARRRRADEIGAPRMRIFCVDDPDSAVLRQKAKPVRHVNRRLRQLLDSMAVTMYAGDGVGLAAPQVGVLQRLLVADAGDGLIELINPELVEAEGEQTATEGCLSIPGFNGDVRRAERVRVKGLDRDGRESWIDAEGYKAVVLQHEMDHLDGVLFTDRAVRVVEVAPETRLRVAFFGTPGFAAVALRELMAADVEPVVVVTRPDAPVGRGMTLRPSPVREVGAASGIPVLTPDRPRGPFLDELRRFEVDVAVVVAYGLLLPDALLQLPRLGAINLHPSLLPRWRGAAPIQRALMAGDATTGVTTMYLVKELDAGDIILQSEVQIEPSDDTGSLSVKLARAGGRLMVETLRRLARDEAPRIPQDSALATYASKITTADEVIDWSRPAVEVWRRIRALAPKPGARTQLRGEPLKVLRARLGEGQAPEGAEPGAVVGLGGGRGLAVATGGGGTLLITQLQPAGRRAMAAADFLNGARMRIGERLGAG